MSMLSARLLFLFPGLLLLAACGGGGGGNGGLGVAPPPPLATITSQNAPVIAGAVASEVLDNNILDAVAGTGLPFAGASTAVSTMLEIPTLALPADVMAAQMPIEPCDVAGTVDVTFDVAYPLTLTAGDEFRFEFDACDDGSGAVVNGGVVMTITVFEGDVASGLYRLGISAALNAFQITEGGETSGASGTIAFEIDTTMSPLTTLTLSTSALTTTINGTSETVTNLSITISEDQSMFPTAISVETSFRLSSPSIDGDVNVSTSIALQSSGEGFPFAGEITITAANNATIVLIALDGNMVRLEIDLDGDGSLDETVDTTWEDLLAAA